LHGWLWRVRLAELEAEVALAQRDWAPDDSTGDSVDRHQPRAHAAEIRVRWPGTGGTVVRRGRGGRRAAIRAAAGRLSFNFESGEPIDVCACPSDDLEDAEVMPTSRRTVSTPSTGGDAFNLKGHTSLPDAQTPLEGGQPISGALTKVLAVQLQRALGLGTLSAANVVAALGDAKTPQLLRFVLTDAQNRAGGYSVLVTPQP
jgi:hypothetical protein